MVAVFQARPREAPHDRPADYAIKVAKSESGRREQAEQLIAREAAVARQVDHPNLIAVLDAQVETVPHYLVMPLLRGATVRTVLDRVGPLIPPQALWIARQVSRSLDALHQAGWMHADIKPSNILVSPEGHATLLDLGFALKLDSPESAAGGSLRGTMLYTVPEMIGAAVPVDGRSDVYSLGATLYEMLTGRPPFTHQDPGQLVLAHLQTPVPDPRRVIPTLHGDVGRLLRDCLAKEPLAAPGRANSSSGWWTWKSRRSPNAWPTRSLAGRGLPPDGPSRRS